MAPLRRRPFAEQRAEKLPTRARHALSSLALARFHADGFVIHPRHSAMHMVLWTARVVSACGMAARCESSTG